MNKLSEIHNALLDMEDIMSQRELTADEQKQYDQYKREFQAAQRQQVVDAVPAQREEVKPLTQQIREAVSGGNKEIHLREEAAYTPSASKTGNSGLVETEIQSILEPLYANSALSALGVTWYKGLPQGDIAVPVMGKGSCAWAGEYAEAAKASNSFTNVTLKPHRLTAFVDVSKMLIAQDTIGAENAIRRDIANAVIDKLEATIFGSGAGTSDDPKGMFNGVTPTSATTFAAVCKVEETVETANVTGSMKYLLSPGAKADLRAMAKGTNAGAGLVLQGGDVDGVPAVVTSNVATAGTYIYGNFQNLAVGAWGDIDITVDPYTQATKGCIRLVVNAYFDAQVLRSAAFAFGKTR